MGFKGFDTISFEEHIYDASSSAFRKIFKFLAGRVPFGLYRRFYPPFDKIFRRMNRGLFLGRIFL
jgi:hypothetical protein